MKITFWTVIAIFVALSARASAQSVEDEGYWIVAACRRDSGAICTFRDRTHINPYFAHLSAIGLCFTKGYRVQAKDWINWYLGHLNLPDSSGLRGTGDDYNVVNDAEVATGDYDSADSYAALFLTLCRTYIERTDDREFLVAKKRELAVIADVICVLQDHDGLTWAKQKPPRVKYLMDNAECYRGLRDMEFLCDRVLSDPVLATKYRRAADALSVGIESLWNQPQSSYDWAKFADGTRQSCDWKTFYPDAQSQLWPTWCGQSSVTSRRAKTLFGRLNETHDWNHAALGKPPNCILGWTAAMMELPTARIHRDLIRTIYVPRRPAPWSAAEAGAFIQELRLLKDEN